MDYIDALEQAGRRAARARAAARQADAERDYAIRAANYHGRMSAREISGHVGISSQRVAQIINSDPIGGPRKTLHDAIMTVLDETDGSWTPVQHVAETITARRLYERKDGQPLEPGQIRARAAKYPHLIEGSTDGTNRIRLVQHHR
jgi:hypothetical protein